MRVQGYHIEGPTNSADFPKWLADMKQWRTEYLKKISYDDGEYRRPELRWAQSSFMQPQMMVEDRYFYDPAAGQYTVNRYLDDLENRYGRIDSVLIWPVYPNIGIDNRNEFDCFRDLPGGIPGIKQMVADFHRRGVRVLFPYMPWGQGTRQEGRQHYEVIAKNLAAVGADGINGDTMPVTWISLEDARAYAAWAGKRLPHEWEWQYAAQGTDGRTYPWGSTWDPEAAPTPEKGHDLPGPDNVDAHPKGASPFGVMDLTGNVWQWTDEYQDEHTRAAILRGGSHYQPQGSMWYFPQAYKLIEHGKLLLMAPGKDRAGTLGFRCVVDAR